jgi:hypothetical protein
LRSANRVTAGSNIYISAFLRGGKRLELLETARASQRELAVTEDILNDIVRVLGTKFRAPAEAVRAFRVETLTLAKLVTPGESLDAVPADSPTTGFSNAPWPPAQRSSSPEISTCSGSGTFAGVRLSPLASFYSTDTLGSDRVSRTGGPCD